MADPKCTSEIRHRWLDIWEQVWIPYILNGNSKAGPSVEQHAWLDTWGRGQMTLSVSLRRTETSMVMHGTCLAVCKQIAQQTLTSPRCSTVQGKRSAGYILRDGGPDRAVTWTCKWSTNLYTALLFVSCLLQMWLQQFDCRSCAAAC